MFLWLATTAAATNLCDDGGPGDAGLITVNGQNYDTIGKAIAAAGDGDIVLVCQGTYLTHERIERSITLRAVDGPDVTRLEGIDLDAEQFDVGNVLTVANLDGAVFVEGFSIVGMDPDGVGVTVTAGSEAHLTNVLVFGNWLGVVAQHDTIVVLVDSEVFGNHGTGIVAHGAGLLGLPGTRVWGNFGELGAGLSLKLGVDSGRTVVGGVIEANWGEDGGGVFVEGDVVMLATEILRNDADRGGGIHVASGGDLALVGVTVAENVADDGGGIYVAGFDEETRRFTTLHLERSVVRDNQAYAGGGIWSGARSVVGVDTEIAANEATHGGGLYVLDRDPDGTLHEGLGIVDNEALTGGGVMVAISERETDLVGLEVSGNTARGSGGGIAIDEDGGSSPRVLIDDSVIRDNGASYGGGIALNSIPRNLTAILEDTIIEDNDGGEGGGMFVGDAFVLTFRLDVRGNTGIGAGARVTGPAAFLSSDDGSWHNVPEDVLTGDGSHVFGDAAFSCDEDGCGP